MTGTRGSAMITLAVSASLGLTSPLRAEVTSPARNAPIEQTLLPEGGLLERRDFVKTAFRSTAISLVRQPVTTFRLGKAIYWRRGHALLEDNFPLALSLPQAPPPQPGTADFESHLDRLGLERSVPGRLDYFVDGLSFFSEAEHQISQAGQSIDLQVFIFDNDDVAVHVANLLRNRSDELPVRVLIDDLGSTFAHGRHPPSGLPENFPQPHDIGTYLTADSRLHLRQTLNPWLVTDHTKLLVFDRETAFLGGMNIGRESRHEWHDLMVGVRGPIVKPLAALFDLTWEQAGPRGDLALLDWKEPIPASEEEGPRLRILRTDAAQGRSDILTAMTQALRGARNRIWIETPYFASDSIARELIAASNRGVEVRVILPARANHGIMDAGNFATARTLMQAGVKVFLYPGMTHLKAMICDGWATVGAANLDTISLRINRELNLSCSDPDLVKRLAEAVFEPDFELATPLSLEDTRSLLAPLIETIADQL